MKALEWQYKNFESLTVYELYSILHLRSKIFVVEQNCVYLDMDNKDDRSFHVCCWDNDNLAAYARIMPPGLSFTQASIGRVVTNPAYRRTGLGMILMRHAIEKTLSQFTVTEIRIGAQLYLLSFYESLGFKKYGPEYLEDGILHIEMLLTK